MCETTKESVSQMLAVAGIAAAVLVSPSIVGRGPILCPVRLLTGRPCPSCGLTRSVVAAGHLDLGDHLPWRGREVNANVVFVAKDDAGLVQPLDDRRAIRTTQIRRRRSDGQRSEEESEQSRVCEMVYEMVSTQRWSSASVGFTRRNAGSRCLP